MSHVSEGSYKQIDISDIALKNMNTLQLTNLQKLLKEMGDSYQYIVRYNFGVLEVQVMKDDQLVIFIGIEEDGYTHS